LTADLVSLLQGLPDVLAFGYESRALAGIAVRQRRLDAVDDRYGWRLALHTAVSTGVTHGAFLASIYLTILSSANGELPIVWIAASALAVVAAFEAVDNLPAAWQLAGQTRESAARITEIAAVVPAVQEPAQPRHIVSRRAPAIELQDVTFAHGTRSILRDLSLAVGSGEHIGIRGATGSGKSTLLDLIVRAWDPLAGTVRVGGADVRGVTREHLRAVVAVMPQHVHVFNTTLRENVRLARADADDARVRRALAGSQLTDFFDGLPEGLETVLGEHGARMSAGERRRLAFARMLLTDAPVVLLDEPTEHLDPVTERAMIREMKAWAVGRTMVIVSHKASALTIVDRVVVIHDGRLRDA
jgi:ABC-type transport system involved in cytochrome bd biosynthesis fused ATPase/permease subunit